MKLNINNIKWRNFFSYGNAWQELDLIPGINLILGYDVEKDKSNASGKSSMLETIPFALFGRVNRDVKKDQIINWRNRKQCEVAITFQKGDTQYQILRGLKPDYLKVIENGVALPEPSDKRDFQKQIENEILNMDLKTFMNLIYKNLNNSQPILSMKKAEKRKFMEIIFGLEFFTGLSTLCNEKLRAIEKKLHETRTEKDYNTRTISNAHGQIKNLTEKLQNFTDSVPLLTKAQNTYDSVVKKAKGVHDKYETLQQEQIEYINTQKFLENHKNQCIISMNKCKTRATLSNEQVKDAKKIKKDLERYRELLASLKKFPTIDEVDKLISTLETIIESKDGLIVCYRDEMEMITKTLTKAEVNLANEEEKIKLFENGNCPTCGAKIEANKLEIFNSDKRKFETEIKRDQKLLQKYDDYIRGCNNEKKTVKADLEDLRKKRNSITDIISELNKLGNPEEKLANVAKLKKRIKRYVSAAVKLSKTRDKQQERIDNLQKGIDQIVNESVKLKEIIDKLTELETKISQYEEKIEEEEKTRKEFESLIEENQKVINTLRAKSEENDKKITKMQSMSDYINCIKTQCKDENAKQYAISNVIPYLNKQTNHYLSEVGTNFYLLLDKWLDVEFKGPGINNCSYGNLSGGEARSVDLSLQFAFLDIARIQAGVFPDILELDELLDSSIDSQSLESVIEIVKFKQLEDNLKIFLVSHRKEVDEIEVDRKYKVIKSNGFSYLEGSHV